MTSTNRHNLAISNLFSQVCAAGYHAIMTIALPRHVIAMTS